MGRLAVELLKQTNREAREETGISFIDISSVSEFRFSLQNSSCSTNMVDKWLRRLHSEIQLFQIIELAEPTNLQS